VDSCSGINPAVGCSGLRKKIWTGERNFFEQKLINIKSFQTLAIRTLANQFKARKNLKSLLIATNKLKIDEMHNNIFISSRENV
jgi:hypothetical protein